MNGKLLARRLLPGLVLLAGASRTASALPAGITGRTSTASAGCGGVGCHVQTAGTTAVTLTGPSTVAPGATVAFTCVVSHPTHPHGGVDIAVKAVRNSAAAFGGADAGTLSAVSGSLHLGGDPTVPAGSKDAGELTQTGPQGLPATFSFRWTAPATPGTYTLQAIGNATTSSTTGPDTWSWAAPLSITVKEPGSISGVSVDGASPHCSGTQLSISWSAAGVSSVRLELSADGGATYPTVILASRPASASPYPWPVPSDLPSGTQYRVRVSDVSTPSVQAASPVFGIATVPGAPAVSGPAGPLLPHQRGLVASVPAAAGSAFAWSVSNGTITGGDGTSQVTFDAGPQGTTLLSVVQSNDGCPSPPGSLALQVGLDHGVEADLAVPVVLDVPGANGARFTTELTLANSGSLDALAVLEYTPGGAAGPSAPLPAVAVPLAAGQQLVVPDAIADLRSRGVPIPEGTGQAGSLAVSFTGLSSAAAGAAAARVTSPSGPGRAGVGLAGARLDALGASAVRVFGLKEDAQDRSNLALANVGRTGPITLRVTLLDGTPGAAARPPLPDVTLVPGQWRQVDRVLAQASPPIAAGHALVERVAGSEPFVVYGMVNDNVTNDGSVLPAVAVGRPPAAQLLPVLVETDAFESELVLANPGAAPLTATLVYTESLTPGGAAPAPVTVTLAPLEQRREPHALDFLRSLGAPVGPRGSARAGTLAVGFSASGAPADGICGARTTAPSPGGGGYGVSYAAVPLPEAASTEAWLFGLEEDLDDRANLALASAGDDAGPVTLRYDVLDAGGVLRGTSEPIVLASGAWTQVDRVLAAHGVVQGYVRVFRTAGTGRFVAYAVVNDGGGRPGTNDGSYLSMSSVK